MPELKQKHEQHLKEMELQMQKEGGLDNVSTWIYFKRGITYLITGKVLKQESFYMT